MKDIKTKREREKAMVSEMIALYCRKKHKTKRGQLCAECTELTEYAKQRSDKCPFMESKTFCSNCNGIVTSRKCVKKSVQSCVFRERE